MGGEAILNRIQVKGTRNSKKICTTDSNKSDGPHLRGKFLVLCSRGIKVVNLYCNLKLDQTQLLQLYTGRAVTGTGRGPRPSHVD